MNLDLTDEESAALLGELDRIIDDDRYPFSPRIRTLTAIRDRSGRSRRASPCRPRSITNRCVSSEVAGAASDSATKIFSWGRLY